MRLLNILKDSKLSRFLSVGALNTLLTLLIYQLLLIIVSASAAYVASWLIGFFFLIIVYPKYVFGVNSSKKNHFLVGLVYISSLLIGKWIIGLLVEQEFNQRVLIIIVISMTTLYNYLLLKILLNEKL